MADFKKLKNAQSSLGTPPSMEDIKDNLAQPEIAPQIEKPIPNNKPKSTLIKKAAIERKESVSDPKTDKPLRTKTFSTKITPDFHKTLKTIAAQYELDMVDIIEQGVDLWIQSKK